MTGFIQDRNKRKSYLTSLGRDELLKLTRRLGFNAHRIKDDAELAELVIRINERFARATKEL